MHRYKVRRSRGCRARAGGRASSGPTGREEPCEPVNPAPHEPRVAPHLACDFCECPFPPCSHSSLCRRACMAQSSHLVVCSPLGPSPSHPGTSLPLCAWQAPHCLGDLFRWLTPAQGVSCCHPLARRPGSGRVLPRKLTRVKTSVQGYRF